MNPLADWLQQPLALRLGWTLLHFLWQGSVVALVFAAARVVLKKHLADARYSAACVALGLMVLAPVLTFSLLPDTTRTETKAETVSLSATAPSNTAQSGTSKPANRRIQSNAIAPAFQTVISRSVEPILPWLTAIWFAGVCAFSLRLFGGWRRVQRLRWQGTEPIGEPWLGKLAELQQRLAITRPVRLLKSALVEVPTVIGWLKPVILLPASALSGLSPAQLESILAHELAHIRRHDYVVNLIQRVVETLLFYHPAVWWISNCIREEREHCCDDLAVAACGDRLGYARALTSLEELRSVPTEFALAADGGSLTQRIRRLFGLPAEGSPIKLWPLLVLLAFGVMVVTFGLYTTAPPPMYRSHAKVMVRHVIESSSQAATNTTETWKQDGIPNIPPVAAMIMSNEVRLLQSRDLLGLVVEKMDLHTQWSGRLGRPISKEEAVDVLRSHLRVSTPPNSTVIQLSIDSYEPDETRDILLNFLNAYREAHQKMHGMSADDQFLITQIDKVRTALRDTEAALRPLRTELEQLRKLNLTNEVDRIMRGVKDLERQRNYFEANYEYLTTIKAQAKLPSNYSNIVILENPTPPMKLGFFDRLRSR